MKIWKIAALMALSGNCFAMAGGAVDELKSLEGSVKDGRLHVVYDDATGKGWKKGSCSDFISSCKGTPTIGYGDTDSARVALGVVSEETAEKWLRERVDSLKQEVSELVKVELSENQLDALVCFAYNVGLPAFRSSTLLKVLNEGSYEKVPSEMRRWVYSGGHVAKGLKSRREKEIALWLIK